MDLSIGTSEHMDMFAAFLEHTLSFKKRAKKVYLRSGPGKSPLWVPEHHYCPYAHHRGGALPQPRAELKSGGKHPPPPLRSQWFLFSAHGDLYFPKVQADLCRDPWTLLTVKISSLAVICWVFTAKTPVDDSKYFSRPFFA